jgi:hypothetical protein
LFFGGPLEAVSFSLATSEIHRWFAELRNKTSRISKHARGESLTTLKRCPTTWAYECTRTIRLGERHETHQWCSNFGTTAIAYVDIERI